ncbi:MAG: putative rane protein [Herbinix sp.]|nr:putative rane protein [Herbinix sp.]
MKNHYIRFPRKKRNIGYRFNIYVILWTMIIIGSVYLLLRFAAISLSDEIGQAEVSYKEIALYYVGNKVMETGSSLVRYQMAEQEETPAFPINFVDRQLPIRNFIKDESRLMAKAQEYSLNEDYVVLDSEDEFVDTSVANQVSSTKAVQEGTEEEEQTASVFELSGIKLYTLELEKLSKEYILTNGVIYDEHAYAYFYSMEPGYDAEGQLEMGYAQGQIDVLEKEDDEVIETSSPGNLIDYTMEQLKDINFLVRNFYIVDPSTKVTDDLFDATELLSKDMTLKQKNDAPQILIYHTHSQEAYADSRESEAADTVVGVGTYLTQILEDRYGYNVIHDTTIYDIVDGKLDRSFAYNEALEGITEILEENPSIEVVIDLHRDGADKRNTIIDEEETAQIMLFNGLSRDENGPITRLDNPNLQDNLAFSLQLQLKGIDMYPGLFYKNYLQSWRYNMHVRPKCILMELGTHKNSLQSAKNAMEPFADVLNTVLQGE